MARKPRVAPRRDDWHGEPFELADGAPAVLWRNIVTGEQATLREGVHPLDNQNAITVLPPPDADEPDDGSEDEPEFTAADRVTAMLRGISETPDGKASVKVYKVREDSKTLVWCADYTPTAFEEGSLEMIRSQWGAGRYEIRVYGQRRTKGWGVLAAERLEISEPLQNPVAPIVDSGLASVLAKMNEKIDALAAAPRIDPSEQIKQTLGLVAAMRDAFGSNQPPPAPQSSVSMIKELMTTIHAMKAIRAEIEPPEVPDDPLAASLPKILELIGAASRQSEPHPFPAVAVPNSMQNPVALAAPALPSENQKPAANETGEDSMIIAFKSAVALLNLKAASNGDIEEAAELVYENAPDDLFEILRAENWFDALAQVAPAIVPFREWYTKLRDRVLAIDDEENSKGKDSAPVAKAG